MITAVPDLHFRFEALARNDEIVVNERIDNHAGGFGQRRGQLAFVLRKYESQCRRLRAASAGYLRGFPQRSQSPAQLRDQFGLAPPEGYPCPSQPLEIEGQKPVQRVSFRASRQSLQESHQRRIDPS